MLQNIKKFKSVFLILGLAGTLLSPKVSYAYPVFAQNAYQNPREAVGIPNQQICRHYHESTSWVEDNAIANTHQILQRRAALSSYQSELARLSP